MAAHIERLLASLQKKSDWRVREDNPAALAEEGPSRACQAVCAYVREAAAKLKATLDGRNLRLVQAELAQRLHRALWAHLRRFSVSAGLGGMRLLRDCSEYRDLVRRLQLAAAAPAVADSFEQLREAANLFVVPPGNLRPLLEEGALLSRLDAAERLALVRLRSDFQSSWIGRYV